MSMLFCRVMAMACRRVRTWVFPVPCSDGESASPANAVAMAMADSASARRINMSEGPDKKGLEPVIEAHQVEERLQYQSAPGVASGVDFCASGHAFAEQSLAIVDLDLG